MRFLASMLFLALPGFAFADETSDLVIELKAVKEAYPDEPVSITAVFHNTGKAERHVVRAIDGSFDGLRSVVDYRWVVKKNGQPVPRRRDVVRIDNYVNALGRDDVLAVKPGKEVDPQVEGFGRFASHHDLGVPGKYTIVLKYELNPGGTEKLGQGGAEALKLIKAEPAVLLESKPIEVTILAWPPAVANAIDQVRLASAKAQIVRQFAETVANNPNASAVERDAASERLKRADAVLAEAMAEYAKKLAEFSRKRTEDRKKK